VKLFGLFMTENNALPQQKVSRSDVASVVKKIFMIPSADIATSPESVEIGQTFTLALTNVKANTQSSTDYSLQDSSGDVMAAFAINGRVLSPVDIDTQELLIGDNELLVLIDNAGVKNVLLQTLDIQEIDTDGDGIADRFQIKDEDNDGVSDQSDNCPLIANTQQLNTDGVDDGGDACDSDDDNDGVSDVDDAFVLNASASIDTDLDGKPNSFHDNCNDECIAASGLTLDVDDDNDGILDTDDSAPLDEMSGDDDAPVFVSIADYTQEATGATTLVQLPTPSVTDNNSLHAAIVVADSDAVLAVGTHVITWTATDFSGNKATAIQLVHIVDTTIPEFGVLNLLNIDARGLLTNISGDVNVVATDIVDGGVDAAIIGNASFSSGSHTIQLLAEDSAGNSVQTTAEVHINPLVELSGSDNVEAGSLYRVPITLSGLAAVYPVTLNYEVSDSASGTQIGELIIEQGIKGTIELTIANNALSGDVISVSMTSATNAVFTGSNTFALTIVDINLAPTVNLSVKQNGNLTSVIDISSGVVTVTADINDLNQQDTHLVVWDVGSSSLVDLNQDGFDTSFEFDANLLTAGTYGLSVRILESNTTESLSTSGDVNLVVTTSLAPLNAVNDADNDGIPDAEEGYSDSDQDGIPDYLDNDSNTTRLPIAEDTQPMRTVNGLRLSLGDVVRSSDAATSTGAAIDIDDIAENGGENGTEVDNSIDAHFQTLSTIINFNVSGLSASGDTVSVVIPLATNKFIPANAVYRKYTVAQGWFDFVEDSNNSVSSAMKGSDGNCPAPLSAIYSAGLAIGGNCIELLIEDGGPNDADGIANGVVKDPGVLSVEIMNQVPVISLVSSLAVDEITNVIIDASNTTDADGDSLTYSWTQLSGMAVALTGQESSVLLFIAPSVASTEVLTFELTVNDGRNTVTAIIKVSVANVNKMPTVSIDSPAQTFTEGDSITLTSVSSDPDADNLTYFWEQISGPTVTIADATGANISFTAPMVTSEQTIEVKLTISDDFLSVSTVTTFKVTNVVTTTPPPPAKESSGGGSTSWLLLISGIALCSRRVNFKKAA
jgi:hypothetical protein